MTIPVRTDTVRVWNGWTDATSTISSPSPRSCTSAARLGIAQPPLSRAIRALERRLRVTLFERTSRQVRLTPAGDVLLREGRRALDALDAATRRTMRAGEGAPKLVLATKPGGDSR